MADSLALQVRQIDMVGILATTGYINNVGGEQVAQACETLMGQGVSRLVLNLEKTNLVNSVGVSFLIETIEKAKGREGQVAFCGLSPTIAKTFQIMGLLQLATLHETEQEAVQALSAG